jgi:hypothetical protein
MTTTRERNNPSQPRQLIAQILVDNGRRPTGLPRRRLLAVEADARESTDRSINRGVTPSTRTGNLIVGG